MKVTTHHKVNILAVRMPLELECQLVQVVTTHLGFVHSSGNGMMTVTGCFNFDARLRELKMLYEIYRALDALFNNSSLALATLRCPFTSKPVR